MATHKLILASKSPRRKELLELMGYDFSIDVQEVEESFPASLTPSEIAVFISEKKASAFIGLKENELLITADTIVSLNGLILGKPEDAQHAQEMLQLLSDKTHEVITGVTLKTQEKLISFFDITEVSFKNLSQTEITYYIENYQPFDKAGSYGIQEWIGLIGVQRINGSYSNVMGLPTEKLASELIKFK